MTGKVLGSVAVFLCGVGFAMCLVYLATLDQPMPTSWVTLRSFWGSYLFNYQTLIAGFAAVFAAAVTVAVMVWTDKQQQARHDDERVRLRQIDARRVERALNPQVFELTRKQFLIEDYLEAPEAATEYLRLKPFARNILEAIEEVQRLLGRAQFVNAMEFFPGELTANIEMLDEWSSIIRPLMKRIVDDIHGEPHDDFEADQLFEMWWAETAHAFPHDLIKYTELIASITKDLDELGEQYVLGN